MITKIIFKKVFFILLLLAACKEPAETAVPKLIKDLSSKDRHVRNTAALKLGSYEEEARAAVPKLIRLLGDENGGVRTSAAFALRSIGDEEGIKAIDSYEK